MVLHRVRGKFIVGSRMHIFLGVSSSLEEFENHLRWSPIVEEFKNHLRRGLLPLLASATWLALVPISSPLTVLSWTTLDVIWHLGIFLIWYDAQSQIFSRTTSDHSFSALRPQGGSSWSHLVLADSSRIWSDTWSQIFIGLTRPELTSNSHGVRYSVKAMIWPAKCPLVTMKRVSLGISRLLILALSSFSLSSSFTVFSASPPSSLSSLESSCPPPSLHLNGTLLQLSESTSASAYIFQVGHFHWKRL